MELLNFGVGVMFVLDIIGYYIICLVLGMMIFYWVVD